MIATQAALIRRELWEHRSLFVVPLVIAVVESLGFIVAQVTATTFGGDQAIDLAVLGASSLGDVERSAAINVLMLGVSSLFVMAMGIVALFYCLDVLYAERKDKSILFWRSLPVTDAETVLSKLITAVVALPVITLGAIAATHIVVLLISSFWIGGRGANAWQLLWTAAPFVDNWDIDVGVHDRANDLVATVYRVVSVRFGVHEKVATPDGAACHSSWCRCCNASS